MIQLRDYQIQAEQDLRAAYRAGARAPLLVLPTGGGKTVLFVDIARRAAERGTQVLVLAHRQELISQISCALGDAEVPHGLIVSGAERGRDGVQVASVQTMARRLNRMSWSPGLIVVDECHHAVGGNTWGKILSHYPAARLLGVTATPERLDGRGLGVQAGGFFDAMVVGPSVRDLVAAGRLSRPVVYAPANPPDLSRLHSRGGDYVSGELDALMSAPSITGDAVAHYRRLGHQEPAIAFCVSVARAEEAAERFRAAGYQSASIDGTLSDRERRERILDLASGQLHVLTSCEIVSEGVDIPVVSVGIMLRPTMSMGLAMQQMGRVLRPSPGKTRALILDHAALTRTHGLPDDDQVWSLDGREKSGAGAAPSAPTIRQCTECYAVHRPAPSCPYCGHVYPIQGRDVEEKAGELVEVVASTKEEIERRQMEARRERAQARSMQELVEMGRRRGYKNPAGWAYNVMRGRERAVAR